MKETIGVGCGFHLQMFIGNEFRKLKITDIILLLIKKQHKTPLYPRSLCERLGLVLTLEEKVKGYFLGISKKSFTLFMAQNSPHIVHTSSSLDFPSSW